jgi:hypothetical protein
MKKLLIFIPIILLFSCNTPGKIELKVKVHYLDGSREILNGVLESHNLQNYHIKNPLYLEESCVFTKGIRTGLACGVRRFEILEKKVTYDN